MRSDPTNQRRPRVAVAVPVEADEAELVADALFGAGASAVFETVADTGGLELVADLDPTTLATLGRPARVLDAVAAGGSSDADAPAVSTPEQHRCGRTIVVEAVAGLDDDPATAELECAPGDVRLVVDAGRAFGSGSHASTRLCLAALEPLAPTAGTVLDVGCGTGVLGVAAALLGPGTVRAVDIDPDAVQVSRLVARRNGVEDRFDADTTPLAQLDGRFDLVLANLLIPIVETLGDDLVGAVAPGGSLVVGGLLLAHRERALAALAPLALEQLYVEGDWVAMVLSDR